MAEPSENEPTGAGKHAAVALWSARARLGSLLLVLGVALAATVLIMQNGGSTPRAVTTASTSTPKGTPAASPSSSRTVGLAGSGIGAGDSPSRRPSSSVTTALAPTSALPIVGTTPTTRHTSAATSPSAPSSSPTAPIRTTSSSPTPPKPTPTPTPTKRCLGKTPICFPAK